MCCSHVALGSLCSGQRWLPSMAVRVKGPEEKRRQPCVGAVVCECVGWGGVERDGRQGEGAGGEAAPALRGGEHRNGGLRQLSTPR